MFSALYETIKNHNSVMSGFLCLASSETCLVTNSVHTVKTNKQTNTKNNNIALKRREHYIQS